MYFFFVGLCITVLVLGISTRYVPAIVAAMLIGAALVLRSVAISEASLTIVQWSIGVQIAGTVIALICFLHGRTLHRDHPGFRTSQFAGILGLFNAWQLLSIVVPWLR